MPSFHQVLEGVDRAWREQRAEVEAAGSRLVQGLIDQSRLDAGHDDPTREILDTATAGIEASFDGANGGWGRAPKFPQPMTIEYLLRRHVATGDPRPLLVARRSLDAMADGGLRDQLGGGFHRYSTDARWLVPHFEQMLYDNAQLARVYVHAWALTGDARYRAVATGTLDYMIRELTTDDGAFAASQDADTDGIEGLTFTWRAPEIRDVLGEAAALFATAYGVTDDGNWEGVTILSRVAEDEELAERYGLAEIGGRGAARRGAGALLARRAGRPQPARDDKALAAWNGLAIGAFADAAVALAASDPAAAATYRAAAVSARPRRSSAACSDPDGSLGRSWKDGRAVGRGRPRGLHPPGRRPAGAVRGDLRRALVHDRPGADGPRPGPLRRPGGRLLRHRRRPRAPGDATRRTSRTTPSRRGVRWPPGSCCASRPGPARAPIATRPNARCARSSRSWAATRPASPSGSAAMDLALAPVARDRDRRRPGRPGHRAPCSPRSGPASGRTRSWPAPSTRPRASCRSCTTGSRSTVVRRRTSVAASSAACRSPTRRRCGPSWRRGGRVDPIDR